MSSLALTGYHRKDTIRVCQRRNGTTASTRRGRLRLLRRGRTSGADRFLGGVRSHCGKRLRPLLPVLLPSPGRHGHINLRPGCAETSAGGERPNDRPDAVDCACHDRGSTRACQDDTGGSAPRSGSHLADWYEPAPGFVEADLVVHCGGSMAGSFASTLVLTDIASGWTECVALSCARGV